MPELLPCPFCGAGAYGPIETDGGYIDSTKQYYCLCAGCAAEGGWEKVASGAVKRWNDRYHPELEACKEMLAAHSRDLRSMRQAYQELHIAAVRATQGDTEALSKVTVPHEILNSEPLSREDIAYAFDLDLTGVEEILKQS